jgi:hypothetical protein
MAAKQGCSKVFYKPDPITSTHHAEISLLHLSTTDYRLDNRGSRFGRRQNVYLYQYDKIEPVMFSLGGYKVARSCI